MLKLLRMLLQPVQIFSAPLLQQWSAHFGLTMDGIASAL
jgi:hypothetical protein